MPKVELVEVQEPSTRGSSAGIPVRVSYGLTMLPSEVGGWFQETVELVSATTNGSHDSPQTPIVRWRSQVWCFHRPPATDEDGAGWTARRLTSVHHLSDRPEGPVVARVRVEAVDLTTGSAESTPRLLQQGGPS